MASKKTTNDFQQVAPVTLDDKPFFGIELDDEQKIFRSAIYDKKNLIVFAEAPAASGKTVLSIGTACIMCDYGLYDGIVYVSASTQQDEIGFLPGSYEEKISAYMAPLYQALGEIREKTKVQIDTIVPDKRSGGEKFIIAMTPNFLRGQTIKRSVVCIDECQNLTVSQLKTILTRCSDDCKVICIGSNLQIDLPKPELSGFVVCMGHFQGQDFAEFCTLTKNHRGKLSAWADKM